MERNFFRLANANAMKQGLFFGLWWVVGFATAISCFSYPLMTVFAFFFFFTAPFVGGIQSYRFKLTAAGEPYTLGQLYVHGVLLYLYASIWLAVAIYVYFAFLDGGAFFGAYLDYLHRPEVAAQLSTPVMQAELNRMTGGEGIDSLVQAMAATPPSVFAANAITTNVMVGFILALPTALVVRYLHVTKSNKD